MGPQSTCGGVSIRATHPTSRDPHRSPATHANHAQSDCMQHAQKQQTCKRGGSERNPQDHTRRNKLGGARTQAVGDPADDSKTRKRNGDHRRPPTRRPEHPLATALVKLSPRRFRAPNRRQPDPLARRDVPMCAPRGRLAGRDAVRTPARREVGPTRNEPDGAVQRRGASGAARCAW